MLAELIHAHHNRYQEDIPFWLGLAAQAGDPVLELGCGTGRVLIPLIKAGYLVTGLDRNLSMLKFLRTNITHKVNPFPDLIAADMSRCVMAAKFPLVILPCNTFSTLEEAERKDCLQCIHRVLIPGGMFAVSMPNPELLRKLTARSEEEIEDEFLLSQSGNPVQVSSSWQRTKHTFKVTWIYDHLLPDGTVERTKTDTVHRMVSLETYIGEIHAAGLRVTEIYGDFDRSDYTQDSPHLIILASRQ